MAGKRHSLPSQNRPKKRLSGRIEITRKGTGFVPQEDAAKKDVEIPTEFLGGALSGDEVEIELTGTAPLPRGRGALRAPLRARGRVLRVLSRAREDFVCTLKEEKGRVCAVPDDARFYRSIALAEAPDMPLGEKVLVHLDSFTEKEGPRGHITETIGKAGEHRTEMNAIVLEHGFSTVFPPEAAREAKEIEERHLETIQTEAPKRSDFREKTTFTIDPETAKDFDDALSVEALEGGRFEIGVHIADVSFFVKEGSALDTEARRRGVSVYLVDATVPMLPEELSAGVCSLKEGQERLVFSAVFTMNGSAEVLSRRFERAIIRSNKRFTYEEAQQVLDEKQGVFFEELNTLRGLAKKLRVKREAEGAIDFGENEYRFVLDEKGAPVSIERKVRLETNSLVEEFMLLANREVAKHVFDLEQKESNRQAAFLYRIHDKPKEDRIEELSLFVRSLGFEFGQSSGKAGSRTYTARDIRNLLKEVEGAPQEGLVRTAALRSMAKAVYATKNIGHFGLAFKYYTHFTSPIRRYPDILVHRILAAQQSGKPLRQDEYAGLEKLCLEASGQEARATDAERESVRYKQVEYLSNKVGEAFEAIVSGVTDWGVYVELPDLGAEGLVRVSSMGDDFYQHRPKEYALVGERTNKKIALGDKVRVKLTGADLSARTLDFTLA